MLYRGQGKGEQFRLTYTTGDTWQWCKLCLSRIFVPGTGFYLTAFWAASCRSCYSGHFLMISCIYSEERRIAG